MAMHEIERNYKPRTWVRIETPPESSYVQLSSYYEYCTSDSTRATELFKRNRVPFLYDYEWLAAGEDPGAGGSAYKEIGTDAHIICIYYSEPGADIMDVELHWYKEVLADG